MNKLSLIFPGFASFTAMALLVASSVIPAYAEAAQDDDHEAEEGERLVSLSSSQLAIAGIVVEAVRLENLSLQLTAPGEVVNNEYRTTHIAPKITAQVVERLVVLGQELKAGEPLLTLYSVDLLRTQSALLIAHREWLRVSELGEQTVGARGVKGAKVDFQET